MRRSLIYAVLAIIWLMIVGWQTFEHQRVRESAMRSLTNRARDLSAALSVVIRSQGRVSVIPKPRLETALSELVHSTELQSVTLLNASGEVAASAGKPMQVDIATLLRTHEQWAEESVSFANLVALGPGTEHAAGLLLLDLPRENTASVPGTSNAAPPNPSVPGRPHDGPGFFAGPLTDLRGPELPGDGHGGEPHGGPGPFDGYHGPGQPGDGKDGRPLRGMNPFAEPASAEEVVENPMFEQVLDDAKRKVLLGMVGENPLTSEQVDTILGLFPKGSVNERRAETFRRTLVGRKLDRGLLKDALILIIAPMLTGGPPPERPPWMGKDDYDRLVAERGVHWCIVSIPTNTIMAEMARDLRLRGIVLAVALLACVALGLAWRTFVRSSNLEIQLVRAQETTHRLQELNTTAAGLVHETKNPLNLIRGLAQMIGRAHDIPEATRGTAVKITEEADRVAGRLNQFLDYARPVQPTPKSLDLNVLIKGVFDVLAFDREEKSVAFDLSGPSLFVRADEDMMRQVLFNLLLNAVQAVPYGGRVEVCVARDNGKCARFDVCDNGAGVPENDREEVFRPYFTTSDKGTGLGLAVVRQIALAHEWDMACMPSETGAVFRVRGIALAPESAQRAAHDQGI